MSEKRSPHVVDQSQGFVMTDEGLLIPGKFLRKMGRTISVAFSPRLIMISSDSSSRHTHKRKQKSETSNPHRERKTSGGKQN
jgi:hypothetical protein